MALFFEDLSFFSDGIDNIKCSDLAQFISKVDQILIDPLYKRHYFVSYDHIAEKLISQAHLIFGRVNSTNKIIALSAIYADKTRFDYAYEAFIGVLKEYQRVGCAKELMKREIELAKKMGMKGLMTNCHCTNIKKINLNKAMGFQRIYDSNKIQDFESMNSKWIDKLFFLMEF